MQKSTTKLHYCTDLPIQYRYRKIKSVIVALGIDVVDVPRQTFADLRELSPIPTLPLLQTAQGNFTSSNTIIRYLASKSGNKLYGGNLYERALIDQWLDLTQVDFDACAIALNVYLDGKQVDIETVTLDAQKFLTHLNKHLKNRKFIVGDTLSIADLAIAATISPVLSHMYGQQERKKYALINTWFHSIAALNKQIQPKQLPKKIHKKFEKKKEKLEKGQKQQQKKDPKQQKGKNKEKGKTKQGKQTKQKEPNQGKQKKGKNKKQKEQKDQKDQKDEKTQQKKAQDDLFGDNDQVSAPAKVQKKVEPKKQPKKKPAAKSIVVFNVKVYREEQDLNELTQKIKNQVKLDGLVWNGDHRIIPIAYGMNMLELGCVIQDEKVSIQQDVYSKLLSWEDEIQSVDTVNFQKL